MSARSVDDENQTSLPPNVSNRGLLPTPLIYLASTALGLLLHWLFPLGLVPRVLGRLVGAAIILGAVMLLIAAMRTFRAAGTPIPGNQPTTTFVRHGPYRFSRNPIYLAFSLLQMGIALWVNSFWLVTTLAGVVAFMSVVVIPREEHYLEARFHFEYLSYLASVRRWI